MCTRWGISGKYVNFGYKPGKILPVIISRVNASKDQTMSVFPQKKGLIGLYLVGNIDILLSEANRLFHARLAFPELRLLIL